jgi:hypothetical protein
MTRFWVFPPVSQKRRKLNLVKARRERKKNHYRNIVDWENEVWQETKATSSASYIDPFYSNKARDFCKYYVTVMRIYIAYFFTLTCQ